MAGGQRRRPVPAWRSSVDTLLVVDEPGLGHAGVSAAETALWNYLRAAAPAWGMHICGRVPWPLIDVLELDLVSFDGPTHGVPNGRDPSWEGSCAAEAGSPGRDRPGRPGPAGDAIGRSAACLSAMAIDLPLDRVAHQSLLTPSCGTGRLSPERERQIAGRLETAARSTRDAIAALGPVRATARTGHGG